MEDLYMKKYKEYIEKFDDTFPSAALDVDTDQMIKIMDECIKKGEPYEFDEDHPQ